MRYHSFGSLLTYSIYNVATADQIVNFLLDEAFLGAVEPSGVFRSELGGHTIFSAKCPACKRIHGNFRTFKEAAGNKMCKYCIRGYVDKIAKVRETGNFKTLLSKKHHDKARH